MFYHMYLSGVCSRRQWPKPQYESFQNGSQSGFYCRVRVNNRVYVTDVGYQSEELATEGAAQKAYMICRNFSVNDGMYPGQRPGQLPHKGPVQGIPVPIGSGRRSHQGSSASYDSASADGTNSSSGNTSPTSFDSCFEQQLPRISSPTAKSAARRHPHRMGDPYICPCGRGPVRAYGDCDFCLRKKGWA